VLNRVFGFAARGPVLAQLRRFALRVAVDYLLTLGAVEVLTRLEFQVVVAQVLAGGTNATFNYLADRFWTFGHEPPRPAGRAQEPTPTAAGSLPPDGRP
jgi:putative flippase GtrA